MARHTLYAYVQGTDLEGVVERIEAHLDELVAGRTWAVPDVWVVNQRVADGEWDLGLNLTLPASPHKRTEWIEDAVAVAKAYGALHGETGRRFVLGLHDAKSDTVKDLFFVDSAAPDLDQVRTALAAAVR